MCSSARNQTPRGLTQKAKIGGKFWGGSRVTFFCMGRDGFTRPHVDTQNVHGVDLFLPAAGTMRSVQHSDEGPAKRAIIVCVHDREKAIRVLDLSIEEASSCQYRGHIRTLEGLARELRTHNIRFVIVDYPPNCSYLIPWGCVHAFCTLRVVESAVWHPCLKNSLFSPADGKVLA